MTGIQTALGADASGVAGEPRVALLLGAGASADAGLPLTSDLADRVVDLANARNGSRGAGLQKSPGWVQAINAVYAGMIGYRGLSGGDPRSAVNIETLISAVRLLGVREKHEIAPFVAAWSPSLAALEPAHAPSQAVDLISGGLGLSFGSRTDASQVIDGVAMIARSVFHPKLDGVFNHAESFIVRTLSELLSPLEQVDYLAPLADLAQNQVGGLDVMTLNYDLTVETACGSAGVEVFRGIESWVPGDRIEFPMRDGVVNLAKLHGSLDWVADVTASSHQPLLGAQGVRVLTPGEREGGKYLRPWIVVGDREKLGTDGPTLDLNLAAREMFRRTTHLVVVGYSFGDQHVNRMIRDWMARDSTRTMNVLDYRLPREYEYRPIDDFRSALVGGFARWQDSNLEDVVPRIHMIEGRASLQLKRALSVRPGPLPSPLLDVTSEQGNGWRVVKVRWHGPDLVHVTVYARAVPAGVRTGMGHALQFALTAPDSFESCIEMAELFASQSHTFFVKGEEPFRMEFRGASVAGAVAGESEELR